MSVSPARAMRSLSYCKVYANGAFVVRPSEPAAYAAKPVRCTTFQLCFPVVDLQLRNYIKKEALVASSRSLQCSGIRCYSCTSRSSLHYVSRNRQDLANTDPLHLHSIDQPVLVRLKWNTTEYKGRLVSVDSYMNIQLGNTEEFIDGKGTGQLGMVMIR